MKKSIFFSLIFIFFASLQLFAQANQQEVINKVWNLKSMSDSLSVSTNLASKVFVIPSYNFNLIARAGTVYYKLSMNLTKWPHWQYLLVGESVSLTGMKIDTLFYKGAGTAQLMVQWGQQ